MGYYCSVEHDIALPTTEPVTTEAPTTEPATTEAATTEAATTEPATTEATTTEPITGGRLRSSVSFHY